jgi:hypothetical protein
LHRRQQRHGISRLPEVGGDKPAKKRFKRYPIGYFHIDLAKVRTAEGKLNLFVAIDRTSKFAFVRLEKRAGKMEAVQFLRDLLQEPPYRIHTKVILYFRPFCSLVKMDQDFMSGCKFHWFYSAGIGLIGGQDAVGGVRAFRGVIGQPLFDTSLCV